MQGTADLQQHHFRPAKRRKFYRKRADTEERDTSEITAVPPTPVPDTHTISDEPYQNGHTSETYDNVGSEKSLSVATLIRQRKSLHRRKGGGIEFTNLNTLASASTTAQNGDVSAEKEDETPAKIRSVIERFAPQTGQVSETTDKHMYDSPVPHLYKSVARSIY